MSYITITLNHVRVFQDWAATRDAQASLDMTNFEMEVKARNRYYRLYPRFIAQVQGRLTHLHHLTPDVHGFIGWLPYRPSMWELARDKLAFKNFLSSRSLATPPSAAPGEATAWDYIFKRSIGSFGYELYGPYHAHDTAAQAPAPADHDRGELFKEAFIKGRNVKVWFWGDTPVHAHYDPYPVITGDGQTTVWDLVARRIQSTGATRPVEAELAPMRSSLAYQGLARDHVLPDGETAWLDYRYGRLFAPAAMTPKSDNKLAALADAADQLAQAGAEVAQALRGEFPAPVLYSLDGVRDDAGKIWWLEMNSNPVLPPDAYPVMLDNLFGTQPASSGTAQHATLPATPHG